MAASEANLADNGTIEAFPDMLKNTPSNIARLEDVIEQSKGRQKYLAQTKSPSDGSDVRWYFYKVPLAEDELAASVPRTEIVGKSDYFRFGVRDSLAIEASFLQREEELLSIWWKEYAECSEGPTAQVNFKTKPEKKLDASPHHDSPGSRNLHDVEEERVGVPVKGGLYEVDLVSRHCFPVYWNGENRRVLRGHWFARKGGLDWLPLREDVAEQLEVAYRSKVWRRRRFQPSGLFAARVDLQGSSTGLHALFTGEDDTWEAWLNVDPSGFTGIIGFTGNGINLRRGYAGSQSPKPTQEELRQQKEEEMDDYCSQVPVRHLVFMVHGIGQRLEKSNLVDDVGNFRQITANLAECHLSSHQRGTQRVLFIPCQWRKGLKLSGETAVDKITLDGVRRLRVMLSATVHDVLYYMSPIYCQDIIDSVSKQLNRLYLKFLKRNPGYDGKVSIYGHSLGSVLSYDILCHQENLSVPFPMDCMYKESSCHKEFPGDKRGFRSEEEKLCRSEDSACTSSPSSSSESSAIVEPEAPTLVNEGDETVGDPDDEVTTFERLATPADFSSLFEHPVATGSDTNPSRNMDMEPASDGVHASTRNPDDAVDLVDTGKAHTELNNPVLSCDLEEEANGKHEEMSDKDKIIKSLREEIDSLRAKLAELEPQSDRRPADERLGQENSEVPSGPNPATTKSKLIEDNDPQRNYTPYIEYTKLEFKVDTFFAVGSPLGVFLSLRNIRLGIGKGQEYWSEENITEEMPACRQMFNIFHPYDPVAYRIEPLVCKEYLFKRPVIVPYHKGGRRLHIGFQEFTEELVARSQAMASHFDSLRLKVLTACQSKNLDGQEDKSEDVEEKEERSYGEIMMERLTGSKDGRIDYVLQDKTFEHPYLQAIGSHTNYWRDLDTALFILKHLYGEIPEDPSSSEESNRGESEKERRAPSWTDPREVADEELPLTFSDKRISRSFSRKAKKFMKKR